MPKLPRTENSTNGSVLIVGDTVGEAALVGLAVKMVVGFADVGVLVEGLAVVGHAVLEVGFAMEVEGVAVGGWVVAHSFGKLKAS